MAVAVVYAFAVADGVSPVAGAAPFDVLARQLPRLLVARLNGGVDRGVRFLPFLGPIDGRRSFLRANELLAPAVLLQLHRQGDAVRLLVDGMLRQERVHWRVIDAVSAAVLLELDLPFDPRRPLAVLGRLEFELIGLLGWTGRPEHGTALEGEALGWFLVLKDELLRREAQVFDDAPEPLRAAHRAFALAPRAAEVQHAIAELAAHLLRRGERPEGLARLLAEVAAVAVDEPLLERLGGLLLACGDEAAAADLAVRLATADPTRRDYVERAAALAFRCGRDDDVRRVVAGARRLGAASPSALAQLAAVCDRSGDRAERAALVAELVGLPDLPTPVARLVVSFLLEDEQPALARTIALHVLDREPGHAVLWFELGRAHLLLDDCGAATAALARALGLGLSPAIAGQARRLRSLAAVPGLWIGTRGVEQALAAGRLQAAVAAARELVRVTQGAAEAWLAYGIACGRREQPRRAERLLRRALAADAGCADAHHRLGILLLTQGRVAEAADRLERAHQLLPGEPAVLLHLAQAMAMLGRRDEATRQLAIAERLGADAQLVAAIRRGALAAGD